MFDNLYSGVLAVPSGRSREKCPHPVFPDVEVPGVSSRKGFCSVCGENPLFLPTSMHVVNCMRDFMMLTHPCLLGMSPVQWGPRSREAGLAPEQTPGRTLGPRVTSGQTEPRAGPGAPGALALFLRAGAVFCASLCLLLFLILTLVIRYPAPSQLAQW